MTPAVQVPIEKWTGKIREITLGATAAEGGTRTRTVTVGGENTLPFLSFEGTMPHAPVVALEVQDHYPNEWSPLLKESWGDVLHDPAAWAKKAEAVGADLIVFKLISAHPEGDNTDAAHAAATTIRQAQGAPGRPADNPAPDAEEAHDGRAWSGHGPSTGSIARGQRRLAAPSPEQTYRPAVPWGA